METKRYRWRRIGTRKKQAALGACTAQSMMHEGNVTSCTCKGFTLIELLLAMTMVTLLTGSLSASLRVGFQAKNHSEEALSCRRAAAYAFRALDSDIQNAPPPRGIFAQPFQGNASSMTLYTRAAVTKKIAPGIVRVTYEFDEINETLVRRITANLLDPNARIPEGETVCRNILSCAFEYYDGNEWTEDWDSTEKDDSLPLLVKITLTIRNNVATEDRQTTFARVVSPPCATVSGATLQSAK